MIPSDRSNNVYNAFYRYVRDGNKTEIVNISKNDIELTLIQYAADRNSAPYIAMQRRIDELNDFENKQRQNKDKWKDRGIGFATAIIVLLIGLIIKWLFGI